MVYLYKEGYIIEATNKTYAMQSVPAAHREKK